MTTDDSSPKNRTKDEEAFLALVAFLRTKTKELLVKPQLRRDMKGFSEDEKAEVWIELLDHCKRTMNGETPKTSHKPKRKNVIVGGKNEKVWTIKLHPDKILGFEQDGAELSVYRIGRHDIYG